MKEIILYYINDKEYLYVKRKVYKIDYKLMVKIQGCYYQVYKHSRQIGNITNIFYSNREE